MRGGRSNSRDKGLRLRGKNDWRIGKGYIQLIRSIEKNIWVSSHREKPTPLIFICVTGIYAGALKRQRYKTAIYQSKETPKDVKTAHERKIFFLVMLLVISWRPISLGEFRSSNITQENRLR
jgi:hypothetical protein